MSVNAKSVGIGLKQHIPHIKAQFIEIVKTESQGKLNEALNRSTEVRRLLNSK